MSKTKKVKTKAKKGVPEKKLQRTAQKMQQLGVGYGMGKSPATAKVTPPANPVPKDAEDLDALWLDTGLGGDVTDITHHKIIVDKPKNFFRTVSDPAYRRPVEIYTHKIEGIVGEEHYVVAKSMRGRIEEARPAQLVTVVYRDGTPRLWPIKSPKDGERDNEAWISARSAAKTGMVKWVKLVWVKRAYLTRDAEPGYAPEPDYTKPPFELPPFNDLVTAGFGAHGIIRDTSHPIYRELCGAAPTSESTDDDNGSDF
jgi:hypothetical protein